MLVGALAAYAVGIETGNPWLGVLAGLLAGAALAAVHAGLVLHRRANQIATGLGVTLPRPRHHRPLRPGLRRRRASSRCPTWPIPGLSDLPFLGPILFEHDPLTYLSFLAVPPSWWLLLFRTRLGLKVRAAGERAEVLEVYGTSAPGSGGWRSSSAAPWPASAAPSSPPPSP